MRYSLLSRALIALILMTLPGTYILSAQEKKAFKPKVMVGPTAGFNLSNVIFVPSIPQGMKQGFDAGLVFRADVEPYAGIWIELDYSQRGWKDRIDENPDLYYERAMTYIHLPIMSHFMMGDGPVKFTIDGGPHFGYFIGDKHYTNITSENSGGLIVKHHEIEIQRKFAWGLGGGLGMEYHAKKFVTGGRLSYYYGLGDFFNNTRADIFGKSSEQIFSAKFYFLYVF